MHTHTYMYTYIDVDVCVCMLMYVCVYIHEAPALTAELITSQRGGRYGRPLSALTDRCVRFNIYYL